MTRKKGNNQHYHYSIRGLFSSRGEVKLAAQSQPIARGFANWRVRWVRLRYNPLFSELESINRNFIIHFRKFRFNFLGSLKMRVRTALRCAWLIVRQLWKTNSVRGIVRSTAASATYLWQFGGAGGKHGRAVSGRRGVRPVLRSERR